ncbi:hypothetical protein EDE09_124103 [Neorhizobium sp. S3-V5DH]|nr:hypothetical protein EDE09_124103 [Neorhizobium sp. S3-V5DH]
MLSRLNEQPFVAPVELLKDEPMLFSASPQFALQEGGPLTLEATTFLLNAGEISLDRGNVVIDTRVHMLKPGWIPAIGGWHCDAIPRGEDGQPVLDHPAIPGIRHYLLVVDCGTGSMTEFLNHGSLITELLQKVASPGKNLWGEHSEEINTYLSDLVELGADRSEYVTTAESGALYKFSARDYHRAIPATGHGWRYFFRASVNTMVKEPLNEIRKQVQVYLPHEDLGW